MARTYAETILGFVVVSFLPPSVKLPAVICLSHFALALIFLNVTALSSWPLCVRGLEVRTGSRHRKTRGAQALFRFAPTVVVDLRGKGEFELAWSLRKAFLLPLRQSLACLLTWFPQQPVLLRAAFQGSRFLATGSVSDPMLGNGGK